MEHVLIRVSVHLQQKPSVRLTFLDLIKTCGLTRFHFFQQILLRQDFRTRIEQITNNTVCDEIIQTIRQVDFPTSRVTDSS